MKGKILEYINKYWMTIVIVFLFILFSPLAVNFLVTKENPFGWGFITEKNRDTWTNFFGSIIGGGATLLGVWWTLNKQQEQFEKNLEEQKRISDDNLKESKRQFEIELQKKDDELNLIKEQRKEDLAIQYRPLLIVENDKMTKCIKNGENVQSILNYFSLKNIGRAEALNITVHVPFCYPYIYIVQDDFIPIVEQNAQFDFMISIQKIDKITSVDGGEIAYIPDNDNISYQVIIEYEDIVKNTYRCSYQLTTAYESTIGAELFDGITLNNSEFTLDNYKLNELPKPKWNTKINKYNSITRIEKRTDEQINEKQFHKAHKEYSEYAKNTLSDKTSTLVNE